MAVITWIKLLVAIFEDEKIRLIESLPDRDVVLIIWFKLLTMAGKCNASGHLLLSETIPLNDENLATLFNRPLNTIRLALETFERLGMICREGTISITNWEKHQNIEGLEKSRELNRIRNQAYRERQKQVLIPHNTTGDVTVTSCVTSRDAIELDIEKDKPHISPLKGETCFDDFWKTYPNHRNKQAALKAWQKLKPSPELVSAIMSALAWQTRQAEWLKDSGKFIPHASTWLNNRRWEDEAPAAQAVAPRRLKVAI